ncbi:tRNA uridine(34) 5-carboxymethylaminomethyl modification radical SAM/GNAT enzyme Elp3 [Patescibacteria group bacterium]|nr:tRNA uridine(34) 5-carboxymethylaminomethyl modification radical SAM/GNAT enzyme Elp3 [Patescibacteria group bacterium]
MTNIKKQQIIKDLLKSPFQNEAIFSAWKRKISKKYKIKLLKNSEIIEILNKNKIVGTGLRPVREKARITLEQLLTKRAVRTSSGVSVITVLTKPYKCPGNCIYCPTEPKMPKSYLSNEPAAQRALRLKFDPVKQVQMRIQALEANGHQVDKIELLVLGGSWTAYTKKYQKKFITDCFYAANTSKSRVYPPLLKLRRTGASVNASLRQVKKRAIKSLEEEQKINEKAKYKIIGITLETRPDEINLKVIKEFRELGCTRVQIGVQHIDNKILKLNQRGHTVEESIKATKLLKIHGFKVDHHYMPDLPGSTPAKDLAMMKKVFTDANFKPDQIKIYPCVVNEYAELFKWFKKKKYKPYSADKLKELLKNIKKITPYWVRINRLVRDIPADSIIAGNKITNLRQYLANELEKSGEKCKCIRCREVGLQKTNNELRIMNYGKMKLFIDKYKASDGVEYFISYESLDRKILYGFLRLRFNNPSEITNVSHGASKNAQLAFPVLKDAAIIRELHVYGQMTPVSDKLDTGVQHKGLGKKLMAQAEKIAIKNNYKKIAVISGIGVREYYRKLPARHSLGEGGGYKLEDTYLVKKLK